MLSVFGSWQNRRWLKLRNLDIYCSCVWRVEVSVWFCMHLHTFTSKWCDMLVDIYVASCFLSCHFFLINHYSFTHWSLVCKIPERSFFFFLFFHFKPSGCFMRSEPGQDDWGSQQSPCSCGYNIQPWINDCKQLMKLIRPLSLKEKVCTLLRVWVRALLLFLWILAI